MSINILHQNLLFKTAKTAKLTEFPIDLINIFARIMISLDNGKVQGEFIDFFLVVIVRKTLCWFIVAV